MNVELHINNSPNPSERFLTWAPSPCRVRVSNPSGATSSSVVVKLSSVSLPGGGAVSFRAGVTGAFSTTLSLTVPVSGASVPFFCAGRFGNASTAIGDVSIEARVGTAVVGSAPVMVRIRKNANLLTTAERDRFVSAFAQLNNQGLGRFTDFRNMHVSASSPEAHGGAGFLPWHRAYLLDLERELQAIDSSVALPYWRFDQVAPNLFTPDFIGQANASGAVQFSSSNPLRFWKTDGVVGFDRLPSFNTVTQSPTLLSEAQTLALGASPTGNHTYRNFRILEGNPHGSAHVSFDGPIDSIPTAARDPLFFLLHCNVDRLWAKWQIAQQRFDPALADSYDERPTNRIGHHLGDTMWPWNGVVTPPRPTTAPGGSLAGSTITSSPGSAPRVRDMIDYQGRVSGSNLGFSYDDVRFA